MHGYASGADHSGRRSARTGQEAFRERSSECWPQRSGETQSPSSPALDASRPGATALHLRDTSHNHPPGTDVRCSGGSRGRCGTQGASRVSVFYLHGESATSLESNQSPISLANRIHFLRRCGRLDLPHLPRGAADSQLPIRGATRRIERQRRVAVRDGHPRLP